jgi:two-component system, NarL family, nitrate/nitrite response regulator NarL
MVSIGEAGPDVVLADDHVVFVEALAAALERHGFTVRAVAFSAAQVIRVVHRVRPMVCLLDRHFTDGDGVDVVARLRVASPATKVVLLSADRDPDGVTRAFAAGAAAYLHKSRTLAALTNAIGRILRDEVVTDLPAVAPRAVPGVTARRLADHLTEREWDCLALLVDGLDTTAMAARLGVSRATVRTHVQALLTKLGVHSRLEAASFAVRHRLLDDGSVRARAI